MKLSREQIVAAAGILHHTVTSEAVKLRWGALQRQIMKDRLAQGEPVSGYRADWLRTSRAAVAKTLAQCAHEFDAQYPHDKISATDLMDVLKTALKQFEMVKRLKVSSPDAS
jgi:hypothetical protein